MEGKDGGGGDETAVGVLGARASLQYSMIFLKFLWQMENHAAHIVSSLATISERYYLSHIYIFTYFVFGSAAGAVTSN